MFRTNFSAAGQRAVPNHDTVLENIRNLVNMARSAAVPIAWIRHFNKPDESPAFLPGTWGAEFSPGCGPAPGKTSERLFEKDVFGAFTGTNVEEWLKQLDVTSIQIAGFYSHMCVSTTTREALMRGYRVEIDPDTTGATALQHELLGEQTADEVKRSALLQLAAMGANILPASS